MKHRQHVKLGVCPSENLKITCSQIDFGGPRKFIMRQPKFIFSNTVYI